LEEQVEVKAYSGRRYPERPVSFFWRGKRHIVEVVEKEWITPEGPSFSVRTEEGKRFKLAYQQGADSWRIVPLSPLPRREDRR